MAAAYCWSSMHKSVVERAMAAAVVAEVKLNKACEHGSNSRWLLTHHRRIIVPDDALAPVLNELATGTLTFIFAHTFKHF